MDSYACENSLIESTTASAEQLGEGRWIRWQKSFPTLFPSILWCKCDYTNTSAFLPPPLPKGSCLSTSWNTKKGTWMHGIRCRLANCGQWQLDSQLTAAFSCDGESSPCVLESTLEGKNPPLWRRLNIHLGSHNHSSNICICTSAIKLRASQ